MKRKQNPRSLTYVYVHGFEAVTLPKHTVDKRAHRAAVEPGASHVPWAARKGRARHTAGAA